jgi:exonuclease I
MLEPLVIWGYVVTLLICVSFVVWIAWTARDERNQNKVIVLKIGKEYELSIDGSTNTVTRRLSTVSMAQYSATAGGYVTLEFAPVELWKVGALA